ncbi:MAG TPA: hypothetical protein VHT34_05995, partial [Clostridia bacterium]|nr:hypothetical protein [Clostridia bacterium]
MIIQKVSGVSYEEYMKTNIFKPLGLTGTCSSLQDIPGNQLA